MHARHIARCRPNTGRERLRGQKSKGFWRNQGTRGYVDIFRVIWTLGWAIGRILGVRDVVEDKIVTGQKFSPTGLTTVQDFRRHEDFQVLVIGANVDRILRSFEVVTSVLEAFDNGEHFSIMDIIVAFCRDALSGPKGNRI